MSFEQSSKTQSQASLVLKALSKAKHSFSAADHSILPCLNKLSKPVGKSTKGQAGVEYLSLFAIILFALLFVVYFFYGNFQTQARATQARIAVDRIASAMDSVTAQGPGSSKVISVYFPGGILNATANGREVGMAVASWEGKPNDIYQVVKRNVTFVQLPLTEGTKYFTIMFNANGNVSISG
ncbi:MAG: hypothetical protein V1644_01725 [Candidatus Micrarchaeota archaeon]